MYFLILILFFNTAVKYLILTIPFIDKRDMSDPGNRTCYKKMYCALAKEPEFFFYVLFTDIKRLKKKILFADQFSA